MSSTITGSCRCGQLCFSVTTAPIMTSACHCTGCRKMSASAYSLSAMFLATAFTVTAGTPVIGGMHAEPVHHFCPHCMTWVYTTFAAMPDLVNVRATMFDDAVDFPPFIETCTSEKLPWATTPARHSYGKFPDPSEFPSLLAEFAAA